MIIVTIQNLRIGTEVQNAYLVILLHFDILLLPKGTRIQLNENCYHKTMNQLILSHEVTSTLLMNRPKNAIVLVYLSIFCLLKQFCGALKKNLPAKRYIINGIMNSRERG